MLQRALAGVWSHMAAELELRADPAPPAFPTPGALAAKITPGTVATRALERIDAALIEAINTPDARLIVTMPPQEGKSTRVAGDFPTWVLTQFPEWRIVVASYGQSLADRNGRQIRQRITQHDLGLTIAPDNGAVSDWTLEGHGGGVLSVGIGGGLTGRPADLLIIDDPIKDRAEADSETYRQRVWDWWADVASTRLAPGAPVIIILTRWHEDDLAGRLLAADDDEPWQVLNIPAQADHRPELGEVDPLGREPGEYLESARRDKRTGLPRSRAQWERIKRRSSRTWTALYQGRPSPDTGNVWQRAWWRRYDVPLWSVDPDGKTHRVPDGWTVTLSWDMTFKDTKGSDYVVGQVWATRGAEALLLDQVRARLSFTATVTAFERQAAKWPQATAKLVEDKANGTAVLDTLRKRVPGLIAVTPTESKLARASATSPYVEAGNAQLPADAIALFDVDGFIDEAAAFPNSAHDDQVDAASQALNRLLNRAGAGATFLAYLRDRHDAATSSDVAA